MPDKKGVLFWEKDCFFVGHLSSYSPVRCTYVTALGYSWVSYLLRNFRIIFVLFSQTWKLGHWSQKKGITIQLVIISSVEPFKCSHFFIGKKKLKSYFKRILHKWPLPNFSKTIFVAKKVKNQFKEPFYGRKIIVFLLKIATPLSVIQFIDHIIRRTKL